VRPEELAALGLQVTGAKALDDESRFEVRLPEAWRQAVVEAQERGGWLSARRLDQVAGELTDFQNANGAVLRLDHGNAADRQMAEETVRSVLEDTPVRQSELPVPPANGNRVTVVARSDEHGPAYITFDETPDGGLAVVDVAAKGFDMTAREAARHWLCEQLAQRGSDPVLHERIPEVERQRGTWSAEQSRHQVVAMRNRLGDRPSELLQSPGPAAEPPSSGQQDQAQASRRHSARPDRGRSGPMER
jgi:hypothetical protein